MLTLPVMLRIQRMRGCHRTSFAPARRARARAKTKARLERARAMRRQSQPRRPSWVANSAIQAKETQPHSIQAYGTSEGLLTERNDPPSLRRRRLSYDEGIIRHGARSGARGHPRLAAIPLRVGASRGLLISWVCSELNRQGGRDGCRQREEEAGDETAAA